MSDDNEPTGPSAAVVPIKAPRKRSLIPASDEQRRLFRYNLERRMIELRMSQADLIRATHLGKDTVSRYCKADGNMPNRLNLAKIAAALDTTPEALYPPFADDSAIPEDAKTVFDVKVNPTHPDVTRVRLNAELKTATAFAIWDLIKDDLTDGS